MLTLRCSSGLLEKISFFFFFLKKILRVDAEIWARWWWWSNYFVNAKICSDGTAALVALTRFLNYTSTSFILQQEKNVRGTILFFGENPSTFKSTIKFSFVRKITMSLTFVISSVVFFYQNSFSFLVGKIKEKIPLF